MNNQCVAREIPTAFADRTGRADPVKEADSELDEHGRNSGMAGRHGRQINFPGLQRVYAEQRVATYPLTETKTPAIRRYDRVGAKGSQALSIKFPQATACGFVAGARNRLTVVDIDSPDERLVSEIEARFGVTPLQVLTPSGGRHLYYRHNGEGRRIRPLPEVDVLGGGNVVAALSTVPKGKYEIVVGSLDDLASLPKMRTVEAPRQARILRGHRNQALFEYCRGIVSCCDDLNQLLDTAQTWADGRIVVPLPRAEIVKTCESVWKYRGGRKRIMQHIVEAPVYEALVANTDALALFAYLSAENGPNAQFIIADGLSRARGWPRRFVPIARRALLAMGVIERIRLQGNGKPALYRWNIAHD